MAQKSYCLLGKRGIFVYLAGKGPRYVLNQYYERYKLPLFIVENGFGYEDHLENGQIHDENRIAYLKSHIEQMMKAVDVAQLI